MGGETNETSNRWMGDLEVALSTRVITLRTRNADNSILAHLPSACTSSATYEALEAALRLMDRWGNILGVST